MENPPDKNSKTFLAGGISTGKDLTALLRDFALLLIFLALIACPEKVNEILIKAGFEEGSFIGIKWKKGIAKSDIMLKEAQVTIAKQQKQLDSVSKVLAEVKKATGNVSLKKRIEEIQAKNTEVKKESNLIQKSVKTTISSNAFLIENAQKAINTSNSWGVVLGTDTTLKQAQSECAIFSRKFGIQNAVIYHRQGFYRSIAITETRSDAEKLLSNAKKRRPDSYIVPMFTWCQNPVQKEGFIECSN